MRTDNKRNCFPRRFSMALTAFLLGASTLVNAAVTVDFNQSQPVTDIIASYDPVGGSPSGNNWYRNFTDNRVVAETFAVSGGAESDFQMEKITMKLNAAPSDFSQLSSFTLSVYEISSVNANPISELLLSAQIGTMQPTKATAPAGYFSLNLDTPVLLESGKAYSYVLSFDSAAAQQSLSLVYNGKGGEAGRGWQQQNGGTWGGLGGNLTYVYYITATAIPEAGTFSLLALGLLFPLLLKLRNRPKTPRREVA